MRYPLTETQALILVRLIQDVQLRNREMSPMDMVVLTQVGAIKMTKEKNANNGLTITNAGRQRFLKWARKNGMSAD